MSLQVWLPLNGNLNNKGVANVPNMSISSCEWIDGKIGKCIKMPRTNTNTVTISELNGCKKFSFCCWLYLDTSYTNSSYTRIFSLGNVSDDNTGYIRIETIPTNGQFQIIYNKSSTHGSGTYATVTYYGITGGNTDAGSNKWVHITVTNDGTNVRTYFNGILKGTWKTNTIYDEGYLNGQLYLGGSYVNLNDVRIYDHCLSAKEVKEISKGLVVHFPLKSQYETGQVNKYSGDIAEGSLNMYGAFTKTKLEGERGYNYKFSYTGNGGNRWDNMDANYFGFTLGKRYFYSCKVRCHSRNFNLYLRASRSSNDWVTNMTNVLNPDGEWHEYVVSQTINSTYDRSGSTVTCNPILEFYTDNLSTSGKVYSADFDIKDVQVIESDCYVPFIDNDMVSNVVSDCSGYVNNGTKVGNIAWENDSPRYSGSYVFNGTNYIKTNYSASIPELSCSFWVKPNSSNGGYAIIASNYNNPSSGFWIAVNCEGSGLWFYNGSYVKGNSLLSNDVWYHGVFTYNNGIGKWYLNGELVTTADISSRGTSLTISNLSIGNSFTGTTWNTKFYGNISDFRLYSKCLSADDVKSIYNVSASIDRTGVLSAYEFVEEG